MVLPGFVRSSGFYTTPLKFSLPVRDSEFIADQVFVRIRRTNAMELIFIFVSFKLNQYHGV